MEREQILLGRIRKLTQIGIMLSRERELERLLATIVEESRRLFHCEAGSLFTVEDGRLAFRIAQNDRLQQNLDATSLAGITLPISKSSIAGYCALTGELVSIQDVYQLPAEVPYVFDKSFDERNNYRTRAVMAIPLRDVTDETLGVLQLINPTLDGEPVSFDAIVELDEVVQSLASQATIALTNARLIEAMRNAHVDTIFRLSVAAEYKDEDTASHLERMCRYSALIATKLGFSSDLVETIKLASPMHDVGKIGIPDAVLLKPGRLTEDEFVIMRRHPEIGARILGGSSSPLLQMAETIALTHHEKWDGTGYPQKLAGDKIPIEGRIVALADVFDALTSKRCYKPAWPIDKAVDFVRESRAKHFDPEIVDVFLASLDGILDIKHKFADEPKTFASDEESSLRG